MISCIICSISPNEIESLKINIDSTIGNKIAYEIVVFDNRIEQKGITINYNNLANQARYDNLVFLHEDVSFLTNGWANNIIEIIKNQSVGIVGVAGSTYLPSVPSGWFLPDEMHNNVYLHQGFKYSNKETRFDNQGKDLTPVYLLDGVFLAMRKEVWQEFPFNEELEGFHAYDVDICQRVSSKYQNIFTNQIELLHHSEGKVDKNYFDAIINYKLKYSNFVYPKRNYKLEYELLNQLYSHLRCYYDKKDCIEKVTPFIKINFLGWVGYFSFKKMLRYAK